MTFEKITGALCFTGALQITASDVNDQGKYECVANNSVGTEYSKSAMLYVKGTSGGGGGSSGGSSGGQVVGNAREPRRGVPRAALFRRGNLKERVLIVTTVLT